MTLAMPKKILFSDPIAFIGNGHGFLVEWLRSKSHMETNDPLVSQSGAIDQCGCANPMKGETDDTSLTMLEQDDLDTLARVRKALYAED